MINDILEFINTHVLLSLSIWTVLFYVLGMLTNETRHAIRQRREDKEWEAYDDAQRQEQEAEYGDYLARGGTARLGIIYDTEEEAHLAEQRYQESRGNDDDDDWTEYQQRVRPEATAQVPLKRTLATDWRGDDEPTFVGTEAANARIEQLRERWSNTSTDYYNAGTADWNMAMLANEPVVEAPVSPAPGGGYRARHGEDNHALYAEAYRIYNSRANRNLNEATGSFPVVRRELVSV